MRQFIFKSLGILMLLATVLMLESWVMGSMPFIIAVVIIPAAGWLALLLLKAGISRRHNAKRRAAARRRVANAYAPANSPARPVLQVVPTGSGGPKVA